MEQNYTRIDHELPLIPLRGLAIFPYMILNFDIGREMSLKALDQAMMEDELVFLTSQIEAEVDEPTTEDFYHVGTICKVKQVIKLPGETVRVLVEGISRGKIKEIDEEKIDELIRILRSWKKEINNTNVVDGDEYVVRIFSGDLVDEYNDKLKYPDNYHEFKKWLDDVYE